MIIVDLLAALAVIGSVCAGVLFTIAAIYAIFDDNT